MPGFPQGHALVIGVGQYADTSWNVPTATRDAEGLTAVLRDPGTAGYDPRNVELLIDGQANRARVLTALDQLANRSRAESVVLISFTCHGAPGVSDAYRLATTDAVFTATGAITSETGISIAELGRTLRAIPARRVLLIVNACFAGHLGPRLTAGGIAADEPLAGFGAMLPDEASNELANSGEGGRAILAAGKPDQRSYFLDSGENSFFGQALISGLQGGAGSRSSSSIGLFELYEYIYRDVLGAARRRVGALQEPTMTLLQGVGPFPVASYMGQPEGYGLISQRPPTHAAVREVPPITFNVTNKRSVISFDGATILGDVRTGHVVEGDLTIIGGERGAQPEEDARDPVRRLPVLRARIEVARNVDLGDRDEAVAQLRLAEGSLGRSDPTRARRQIDAALTILRTMNNAYINSVVRKLEAITAGL